MHALPHLQHHDLIVRLPGAADVDAIVHYYASNREALGPFEPRRQETFYTPSYWQARVAQNLAQFQEGRSVSLFLHEADKQTVIGSIGLSNIVGYPLHGATLGYSLAATHWGRGVMHTALTMTLPWAFAHFNLHRIAANHLPDNERSARLLARLGFEREGYARDYLLIDGLWRDHVLTALTRQHWQSRDFATELVLGGSGTPVDRHSPT
jgi:ribosomal-protein-alanine N-acetyltransferase